MTRLPPLDRAVADTRRSVRASLQRCAPDEPLVLVALSGGADSLALAAATAFEAPRLGMRAGALVVDHGLQDTSSAVAHRAAEQARGLGLDPVLVERVEVDAASADGPEAAAREARYAAFEAVRARAGAALVLTAHTRDDQAEQVLLALARGSGARSLAGIPRRRGPIVRPFLGGRPRVTRATTEAACAVQSLVPWKDPHNADPSYARVRVRRTVLPLLERELGPGVAESLARTAELAREDAEALDALAAGLVREAVAACYAEAAGGDDLAPPSICGPAAAAPARSNAGAVRPGSDPSPVALDAPSLAGAPAALRQRAIRLVAAECFGSHLSREHTLAVAALVTAWRGQGPIDVPGVEVRRVGSAILFSPR